MQKFCEENKFINEKPQLCRIDTTLRISAFELSPFAKDRPRIIYFNQYAYQVNMYKSFLFLFSLYFFYSNKEK